MWESLPPIVLFIIYEHLDLNSKLSASKTCKTWREALFNPRSAICEKLHLKFLCKPSKFHAKRAQTDLAERFIKHAKSLKIDWCTCHEDVFVQVLSSVNILNYITEQVHFVPKGRFFGCIRKTASANSQPCNKTAVDTIINYINMCKKIKCINFGLNHYFCHSRNVLALVERKLKAGELKELNVANYYRLDTSMEQNNEFDSTDNLILHKVIENIRLLSTVTAIYVNWDNMFEQLVTALSKSSISVKILGLLVHNTLAFTENISELPVTNLWTQLKAHIPELKVKLTLTEIYKGYVKLVLDKEIPLSSLSVINYSEDFAYIVLDILKTTQKGSSLEEIAFHYIEGFHFSGIFPMVGNPSEQFGSYSLLITGLEWMNCLKRFSWSGLFIRDTDVLQLVTQHASTLEDLVIHKQDIVCESQATQQYFIPLAAAKVYGLERTVSTIWGRPWKLLQDPPVQRLPRRGIRGYRYDLYEEMFWVLQNKAC